MKLIQDITPVKHRSQYPGGETAYMKKFDKNTTTHLIEMPISSSLKLLSGRYTKYSLGIKYEEYIATITGNFDQPELQCKNCLGTISRFKTDEHKVGSIEYGACASKGFLTAFSLDKSEAFVSSRIDFDGNTFCPNPPLTPKDALAPVDTETIYQERTFNFALSQTGYSSKRNYHDYAFSFNREKGKGGYIILKGLDFNYKIECLGTTFYEKNDFPGLCNYELYTDDFKQAIVGLS